MIDTLRTLAQPLSHWVMENRDLTIVVLGLLLMWTTGQALVTHWRSQRLHRDMAESKDSRAVVRRTYAATTPTARVAEPEATPAGLPPVRGGRTYARNLGNALQKAGIATPPVYSPPTPAGWTPSAAAPGRGAPQAPPTYPAPAPPWASPAPAGQPPAVPWASPAPPMHSPAPPPAQAPAGAGPWPTYVPPAPPRPMPAPPGQPGQPSLPFFAGPRGPMGPAMAPPTSQPPAQYGTPAAAPSAPVSAPLPFPGWPLSEPVPPPLPSYTPAGPPPVAAIAPEPAAPAPAPAAKPKRRKFSLSVLQNLEKTLQRTTGIGQPSPAAEPRVAPPAPAPEIAVAPAPVAAKPPAPPSPPVTTWAPPREEIPAPADETEEIVAPAAEAEEAAPPVAEVAEVEEVIAPPAEAEMVQAEEAAPEEVHAEEPAVSVAEVAPEPTTSEPEAPVSDTRAAMRAMLFGEDEKGTPKVEADGPAPAAEPAAETEEAVFRFEPIVADTVEPADHATQPEEAAEPVEAAAEQEQAPPIEMPAEPAGDVWDTAPTEFTPSVTEEKAEPAMTSSPFEVPMTEPLSAEIYGKVPDFGQASTGGIRGTVVIIEDDPNVADYYATLFRGNGYNMHVASDGISGVDLCAKVQPQVILLDVMMPRQNGMLVLQTLRASDETKDTPVIVLSNFSEPTLVKRALQLGALEYVIKTQVEGAALLEAMPRWLNREKAFAAA